MHPVHLAERLGEQLQALAVRAAEVQRHTTDLEVLDAGRVEPAQWQVLKQRLDDAGIEYLEVGGVSLYFSGPDGERLELLADPLGEMYGQEVL